MRFYRFVGFTAVKLFKKLVKAISLAVVFSRHRKAGRVSMARLNRRKAQTTKIEIADKLPVMEKYLRKNRVMYHVKKVRNPETGKPRWEIWFRKDQAVLVDMALKAYGAKVMNTKNKQQSGKDSETKDKAAKENLDKKAPEIEGKQNDKEPKPKTPAAEKSTKENHNIRNAEKLGREISDVKPARKRDRSQEPPSVLAALHNNLKLIREDSRNEKSREKNLSKGGMEI